MVSTDQNIIQIAKIVDFGNNQICYELTKNLNYLDTEYFLVIIFEVRNIIVSVVG